MLLSGKRKLKNLFPLPYSLGAYHSSQFEFAATKNAKYWEAKHR